jgi:integrase
MGKSHQKGWIVARGKKWYGYFRREVIDPASSETKSTVVPVVLGLKTQLTKFEARESLEREIAKQNGHAPGRRAVNNSSVTFGWFVRNRFLPLKEASWKEETAKVKTLLIQQDLIDEFEDVPMENFDKFTLQIHLNKLAKTRSKDRVLQMRAYLRDIFAEAADQDFLPKDPARKVKVPTQLRETDKTTLTWDQLRRALSELDVRDRLLLELDMTNALRPSELFAFRWRRFDYQASTLTITETVYKGNLRDWGKTKKSLTVIHIPRQLADDLQEWRLECEKRAQEAAAKDRTKSPLLSPDDFIFANEVGRFLDTDNYRKRVLHKLARDLNLPKLTFQVIRRTIATLAQKKGTVKDVQGVLRHSRTATTTDVYMQEIPESVQATVNSIHSELRPKLSSRTAKVWTAERRAQASVRSKERLAAKKISATEREKGESGRSSAPALNKGFGNLLPNATKPEKRVSVSY